MDDLKALSERKCEFYSLFHHFLSMYLFVCVCVYIHACVNVLCVFVCISLLKVNLIVMWTTKKHL